MCTLLLLLLQISQLVCVLLCVHLSVVQHSNGFNAKTLNFGCHWFLVLTCRQIVLPALEIFHGLKFVKSFVIYYGKNGLWGNYTSAKIFEQLPEAFTILKLFSEVLPLCLYWFENDEADGIFAKFMRVKWEFRILIVSQSTDEINIYKKKID